MVASVLKNKKPQRTCIYCRKVADKKDLIRVVRDRDGIIAVDQSGRKNGRGAYICNSSECTEGALKKGLFDRAFKVSIKPAEKEQLRLALEALESKE